MFCGVYGKMCSKNNARSGALEIGFSTVTILPLTLLCLCRNFWPKTAQLLFCTFLTSQIWHPLTFFIFQNSSWHTWEEDLMASSQFKNSHRLHLLSLEHANVFNNGENAVLPVSSLRENCFIGDSME